MLTTEIDRVGTSIARPVRERVQDLECFVFSAVMIPAYLSSALAMSVLHPAANVEETTADQDFFINALYGISHDPAVRIHYNARIPDHVAAVTYGNRIYTNAHRSSKLARRPLFRDRYFQQSTKLLLHELAHVMQFRAFDHSLPASGWAYLKGYCNVRHVIKSHPLKFTIPPFLLRFPIPHAHSPPRVLSSTLLKHPRRDTAISTTHTRSKPMRSRNKSTSFWKTGLEPNSWIYGKPTSGLRRLGSRLGEITSGPPSGLDSLLCRFKMEELRSTVSPAANVRGPLRLVWSMVRAWKGVPPVRSDCVWLL